MWPYAAASVFNPAATTAGQETLLLVRVEDRVRIYYGAADTSTCLPTANLDDLLGFVKAGSASGPRELP